jgi:hypothetical protein
MIKYYRIRNVLFTTLFIATIIASTVGSGLAVVGAGGLGAHAGAAVATTTTAKAAQFTAGALIGAGAAPIPAGLVAVVGEPFSLMKHRTISFKVEKDNDGKQNIKMSLYKYNEGTHLYVNNVTVKRIFYEEKKSHVKFYVTFEKPKCPFKKKSSKRCQAQPQEGGYKHKRSQKKRNRKLKQKKTRSYGKKSKLRRKVKNRRRTNKKK